MTALYIGASYAALVASCGWWGVLAAVLHGGILCGGIIARPQQWTRQ